MPVRAATSPIDNSGTSNFVIGNLHAAFRSSGSRVPRIGDRQCQPPEERAMSSIEQSVEVQVPIRTAYDQWTQFEDFPRFMEGVESVHQLDDTHLHWVAEIAGARREWDAEITEQRPEERVAWRSTSGTQNAGAVTFHRLAEDRTKVMLQLDVEPEGLVEQAGDRLGFVRRQAEGDLARFKDFIEDRGSETGAWRGTVDRPGA